MEVKTEIAHMIDFPQKTGRDYDTGEVYVEQGEEITKRIIAKIREEGWVSPEELQSKINCTIGLEQRDAANRQYLAVKDEGEQIREVVEGAGLTSEMIKALIDKAEEEYADVDMTDAEWEEKRWMIIAEAMKQVILKAMGDDSDK